jgi:cell division protein FtsZ
LKEAVEGISDLITTPGIINIDFADIRSVMENAGAALMGIGSASGDNRAEEAARLAISSPLLEISINGAKGVLFSIAGGDDVTMFEIQDAAKIITESVDPNAKIIFGTVKDDKLKKGELKITVIASSFPENMQRKATSLFQSSAPGNAPQGTPVRVMPEEDIKSRVFSAINSNPLRQDKPHMEEKKPEPAPAPAPAASKPAPEEEDDWGAVPAFLRRSKLK